MASTQSEADRPHLAPQTQPVLRPRFPRQAVAALLAIAVVVFGLSAPAAMAEDVTAAQTGDEVATAEDSDTPEEETETVPGVSDDTLRQGATVYTDSCSSCHQAGGVGIEGTFPPLVDNPNVTDADYVRQVIVDGKQGAIEVNGVS
ncbi:MAG: c-type cytochrome, partial [Actinomycetia bacterium]|nr:c-type cytochrome [Actinomycetes bacterium]